MSINTLGAMLRACAAERSDRDAIVFPEARISYEGLDERARRWARAFIALGVEQGEHVGILLPTCPEFIAVLFGIAMTGAVAVPVNARYQATELAFLIRDADLRVLVTSGKVADHVDFRDRLRHALPTLAAKSGPGALGLEEAPLLRSIVCIDDGCDAPLITSDNALAAGTSVSAEIVDQRIDAVSDDDIALVLYTSGTTANPKGALISHRAIVCNSRNLGGRYQVGADDKIWSPLPIFHIGGILPMTMILDAGGTYLTLTQFDPAVALRMLGSERATIAYPAFVTIMRDLITDPTFASTDLSNLRIVNSSLGIQPPWIKEAMIAAMPAAVQVGTYGLTEGAGTVCTSRLDDPCEARTSRLGVPLSDWEVKIMDLDTGAECAPDERGEIVLRGPHMLSGYYNAPEKTAEVIRDGWLHTGDIGSLDGAGQIMFHGRTKDMLKVGGENVAAAEIEALLQSHPAVKLAQVVAIPDDRYSEVPAAFVELTEGAETSESELIEHCRGKLAGFKIPRHVRIIDAWPMSTSKIQKFRLQRLLVDELAQAAAR